MGLLDSIDNLLGTRLGLLVNDPRAAIAQMNQQAGAFNQASILATQAERNAMNGRPSTPEQLAAKQYIDKVNEDLAMGFAGNIKPVGKTPYELAQEVAQKNAVEMLGLPANNTAADRAKALGFDKAAYHATNKEFKAFDPAKSSSAAAYGPGAYVTYDPTKVSGWAKSANGSNVMPLLVRNNNVLKAQELNIEDANKLSKFLGREIKAGDPVPYFSLERRAGSVAEGAKQAGFSGVNHFGPGGHGLNTVFSDPTVLRSRFAAFDPARVNEPDLLAAGVPLGLIAGTQIDIPKKKEKRK